MKRLGLVCIGCRAVILLGGYEAPRNCDRVSRKLTIFLKLVDVG
jgi:hypothetical protein